jgi:hypothetical protein
MTPISRKDAISQGLKWYFTGKPCKHGHISKRQTTNKVCHECSKIAYSAWAAKNLDYFAKKKREYRAKNPEICAEISKRSRLKAPWKVKERNKRRYALKRHEYLAHSKARKAAQRDRLPIWSDRGACNVFYAIAARATKCTGIRFSVDHILPLRGKHVSGLHVPENLRVMPLAANIAKGNRA